MTDNQAKMGWLSRMWEKHQETSPKSWKLAQRWNILIRLAPGKSGLFVRNLALKHISKSIKKEREENRTRI